MTTKINNPVGLLFPAQKDIKHEFNLFQWLINRFPSRERKIAAQNSHLPILHANSNQPIFYPVPQRIIHEKSFMDEALVEYVSAIVLIAQVQDMDPTHERHITQA